jgi:hypothetical protein
VLAVLCTPALLEPRAPDWVLLEIETFLAGKTGTAAKVVPIEFADTLSGGSPARIAALLRGFIYLHEEASAEAAPAPAIVEALVQSVGAQRRDGRRQRFFRALAAVFFVLAVLSMGLAAGIFGALRQSQANLTQARNNLAELYMDEARRRLELLDVGAANAFAAAALGQADRADARRLIVEHPALTTRLIHPMPPGDWAVWALAYDRADDRFMFAGSDGDLWLLDGKADRPPRKLPGVLKDMNSLVPSPGGSRVAIGTYKGAIHIRSPRSLDKDICAAQSDPKGIGRMVWLDEDRLAFAAGSLSVLDVAHGCAVTAGPENEAYFDLAIDRKSSRLFAAGLHRLVRYAWAGGALRKELAFDMPMAPAGDAPLEPQKIAWLAGPERLAVAVYQPMLWLFDRELHRPKQLSFPGLVAGRRDVFDQPDFYAPRMLEEDPYSGRVYLGDLQQLRCSIRSSKGRMRSRSDARFPAERISRSAATRSPSPTPGSWCRPRSRRNGFASHPPASASSTYRRTASCSRPRAPKAASSSWTWPAARSAASTPASASRAGSASIRAARIWGFLPSPGRASFSSTARPCARGRSTPAPPDSRT